MHVILYSLCYAFSSRHFPTSRVCQLCHLSISCWFSPFPLASRHDGGLRGGFDVGFPCHSALVLLQFVFLRVSPARHAACSREVFDGGSLIIAPSLYRPPHHAGGSRVVLDGGLPYHSPFFVSPPPATLAIRGRFLTVVCLIIVSAFPSITFLRVFPGFIAKPFRGVGVGFEESHLRLMF